MMSGTSKVSVTEYDEGGFVINNVVRRLYAHEDR